MMPHRDHHYALDLIERPEKEEIGTGVTKREGYERTNTSRQAQKKASQQRAQQKKQARKQSKQSRKTNRSK